MKECHQVSDGDLSCFSSPVSIQRMLLLLFVLSSSGQRTGKNYWKMILILRQQQHVKGHHPCFTFCLWCRFFRFVVVERSEMLFLFALR